MVTFSEHPKTLDEVQATIQKHLGDPGQKKPNYTIDRPSKTSNRLCFHATNDVRYEIEPDLLQIVAKSWRLLLNLDLFLVKTEFAKDRFCLGLRVIRMRVTGTSVPYYVNSRRPSIPRSIPGFCARSGNWKAIFLPP